MASQDQKPTQAPTAASQEEAAAQLKEQLSNFFGFFGKVSKDISTSSSALSKALPEKNPITLIEAKRKQPAPTENPKTEETSIPKSVDKVDKHKPEKSEKDKSQDIVEVATTSLGNIDEKQAKPRSQKGDKSNRGPALKEGTIHIEPPKPRYNSFLQLFGSIGTFFSKTTESLETGTAKAYNKVKSGLDLNKKIKNGLTLKKKDIQPAVDTEEETRKKALNSAGRKRLEEAKRMKENFEKQLRSLDQEILLLERSGGEDEEGSRSRQNLDKKEKKSFRISSQRSGRESHEKSTGPIDQPNIPKPPKKMLNPIEDGKPKKKWQDGEKGLKPVASQPLYMRMEKEFMQNVVFPELEARKEKLKIKREFYKPMEEKDLREHALKYEERKKALAPVEKEIKQVPLNFQKSETYKKVIELEKEDKVKGQQKVDEKKQLKDKQQQYAKLVKEMFFPKPDPKDDLISKENLQDIIKRSQKAELPVMTVTTKDTNNTTNMGVRLPLRKKRSIQDVNQQAVTQYSPERSYVPYNDKTYLRKKVQPKVNVIPPLLEDGLKEHIFDLVTNREDTEEEQVPEVKPKKKYENKGKPRMVSMSPNKKTTVQKGEDEILKKEESEPEIPKKSYPNYLAEIRKKRIEQEEKTGAKKYGQWEKILKKKGLSQQEKVANIMDDINRIEFQAKLKENKLKQHDLQREYQPHELEDEVGEMYLESIKAKLAIIKDLS